MYPPGFQTWVMVDEVTKPLEGKMRPEHFRGVTTVVAKIFNAVQPDKVYFGQKDAQQVVVLRRLVKRFELPPGNCRCTQSFHEPNGLAMSSRNVYLNPEERQAATVLSRALGAAEKAFKNGDHDADQLKGIMTKTIAGEELAELQYASCADAKKGRSLDELSGPIQGVCSPWRYSSEKPG